MAKAKRSGKGRLKRFLLGFFVTIMALWMVLQLWMAATELSTRWYPDYPQENLASLAAKTELTQEDYRTFLLQTGLSAYSVDYLRERGQEDKFFSLQEDFFAKPLIFCGKNTPVSAEEYVTNGDQYKTKATEFIGLEDGDILISSCCHTFGWRNGHAAIVVDAEKRISLESVVLGTDSCLQDISKWECYAACMVFRLKGVSPEERAAIAKNALENLNGIPYGLTVGLTSTKYLEKDVLETHCAHLVWEAYKMFGYDLDSNAGPLVTPYDLANSPLLELKQVYGLNPDVLWK